jgi:hypothetical protein
MDGPQTEQRAPFVVRNHREDNKGASLQVELRVGQEITCAKLCDLDTLLVSTGRITGIPNSDDRGCRTQVLRWLAGTGSSAGRRQISQDGHVTKAVPVLGGSLHR